MSTPTRPLAIRMHPDDNVAIIANDGGLPADTVMPDGPAAGLTLRDKVPQGHKVALTDIAAGQAVVRYNVPVGYAREAIAGAGIKQSSGGAQPLAEKGQDPVPVEGRSKGQRVGAIASPVSR